MQFRYYPLILLLILCQIITATPHKLCPLSTSGECELGCFISNSKCYQCQPGTISITTNSKECSLCPVGFYQDESKQTTCKSCLNVHNGHHPYTIGEGSTSKEACLQCPLGYSHHKVLNMTSGIEDNQCLPCPPGYYKDNPHSYQCKATDLGYYTSQAGSIHQLPCPPGSHSDSHLGSTTCHLCDTGHFNPVPAQTKCFQVKPGFGIINNRSDIEACQRGSHQSHPGGETCLPCPTGTYAVKELSPTTITYYTTLDEILTYEGSGSTHCATCPHHQVNPVIGQETCYDIPSGYVASTPGELTACNNGYFANHGPLAKAHIQSEIIVSYTQCQSCPKGHYCPSGDISIPSVMSDLRGTLGILRHDKKRVYTPLEVGYNMSFPCDYGTFQHTRGQSTCKPCPIGTYSHHSKGAKTCLDCPIGSFASTTSSSECQVCSPGSYAEHRGSSQCNLCPINTYQKDQGEDHCNLCVNTSTSKVGSIGCDICGAGHFYNVASKECQICEVGKYQSLPDATECLLCDTGYTANVGATSASQCVISPIPAIVTPVAITVTCPGGYINVDGKCVACHRGYESSLQSRSITDNVCTPCQPGSANSLAGHQCVKCSPGTYMDISGGFECKECSPGTISTKIGSVTCDICKAGTIQRFPGQSVCTHCPKGTYSVTCSHLNVIDLTNSQSHSIYSCPVAYPDHHQSKCQSVKTVKTSNVDAHHVYSCPSQVLSFCASCPNGKGKRLGVGRLEDC